MNPELEKMTQGDWMEMTEDTFQMVFKGSAVKRTGYKGLKRNLAFVQKGYENLNEGK